MINRKLCGIFEFSLAPLRKSPIFLLFVFSIFAPLQTEKSYLQPFSYNVVCARTLYIGKTSISVLFAVCSRFLAYWI